VRFVWHKGFPMYHSSGQYHQHAEAFPGEWPGSAACFCPRERCRISGRSLPEDLAKHLKKLVQAEARARSGKNRSDALKAVRDRFYTGDIASHRQVPEGECVQRRHRESTPASDHGGFQGLQPKLPEWWYYGGVEVYKHGP